MQYLLMLYVCEPGWDKLSTAEQEQGVAAYAAYTEALTKASVLKSANRLQPSLSATTVRNANGKTQAQDGPYRALLISPASSEMLDTQCRFIDAAKQAGVRHVVKFSGKESGIGFDPMRFRFTRMHEQIEDYLEASGVAWTHLRPSQFMQVYLREAPMIAAERVIPLALEDVALAPIDVRDIAKVAS